MTIADAPYIRDAEMNGVDYPKTELEISSERRRLPTAAQIREARDFVQMAAKRLDDIGESVWDEEIRTLMDEAESLACKLDSLKYTIWHL